jgi:hypothetical protein
MINIEVLAKLADSEDIETRCIVSEHPCVPRELLLKLANDAHPDVRFSLAENHNIPIDILKTLCEDENPYVAARAARTLERIAQPNGICIASHTMNIFAFAS